MQRRVDQGERRIQTSDTPTECRRMRLHTLLLAAVMTGFLSGPASAVTNTELLFFVKKKAATLANLQQKAKRALVNAAQDRAFESYFHAQDQTSRDTAKRRIEEVTLATQRRFRVEEMCLIDTTGTELTRIVGNEIAPDSDLSTEEAQAAFFKPGFAEQPRRVYVANPYMSPDANKWVLAYVTPVMTDGEKKAILHYEHGLEIYQAAVNKGLNGNDRYLLVVSRGGFVISDSRTVPAIEKRGDSEDPADYFQHLSEASPDGLVKIYESASENRTGVAKISDGAEDFDVAYAAVEGGLVVLVIQRRQ